MTRSKKPHPPGSVPPPIAPSKTSHLFGIRKSVQKPAVTREDIAADMEAFHRAGGRIEVLGVTRSLQRIGTPATADTTATDPPAPPKRRR